MEIVEEERKSKGSKRKEWKWCERKTKLKWCERKEHSKFARREQRMRKERTQTEQKGYKKKSKV